MSRIILGFVGSIASGKGTTCEYLKKNHDASVYRFSTILRDILDRIYIEQSRDNLQNLSLDLRKRFGEDLLAKAISKDVKNEKNYIIAIDGVRREPDIKYLKEIPEFNLVFIDADQKIRFERITKRGENSDDTKKTFADFQKDEQKEAELQIKDVSKLAKLKIDNNGTFGDLYQQIEKIIKKLEN